MNPNSQHQQWSLWTFTVTPGDPRKNPSRKEMAYNCAKFGRQMFGSTGQMKVEQSKDGEGKFWTVWVRTEGHPVHDPQFRERMIEAWAKFFRSGFGAGTHTHCQTKHEAGDQQDGKPPDQLLILPPLRVDELMREH